MFFWIKNRKKFIFDRDIFNYLRYLCFEIAKRYFLEFNAIDTDGGYIHLLAVLNKKIILQE